MNALVADAESKLPGLLGVVEPDAPGMHQTVTVDYVMVVAGALWLELDEGAEVHLPTARQDFGPWADSPGSGVLDP